MLNEKKSIFIDFGSGDGKVIRCLSQNMTCSYFFGYEIKHNLVNISKKKNKLGNVKFIQKNLNNFASNIRIFNFIKKENIKFINIFFYNPFSINIIIKIINCFKKFKNLRIILLGFNESEFKELKRKINIKTKLHLNINSLYILNNDKIAINISIFFTIFFILATTNYFSDTELINNWGQKI